MAIFKVILDPKWPLLEPDFEGRSSISAISANFSFKLKELACSTPTLWLFDAFQMHELIKTCPKIGAACVFSLNLVYSTSYKRNWAFCDGFGFRLSRFFAGSASLACFRASSSFSVDIGMGSELPGLIWSV